MKILLVDDDEIQAFTRKVVLENAFPAAGVSIAKTGSSALELIDQDRSEHSISLVITDHSMPGMNGIELTREIRNRCSLLPVIVLSGVNDLQDAYEGLNVICRTKPFSPVELIALCREIFEGRCQKTA